MVRFGIELPCLPCMFLLYGLICPYMALYGLVWFVDFHGHGHVWSCIAFYGLFMAEYRLFSQIQIHLVLFTVLQKILRKGVLSNFKANMTSMQKDRTMSIKYFTNCQRPIVDLIIDPFLLKNCQKKRSQRGYDISRVCVKNEFYQTADIKN